MKTPGRFRRLYAIPLLLAVLTSVGLVSALLGDGVWDALSWLLLIVPLYAAVWCVRSRKI